MAIGTVRLASLPIVSTCPLKVKTICDWSKMRGINTTRVVADMVKNQSIWNEPDQSKINKSMSTHTMRPCSASSEKTIPFLIMSTKP